MPLNDPFRNYDAWLTTDRMGEAREAEAEAIDAAWAAWVDTETENGGGNGVVPYEAMEPDHPAHPVYEAWLVLLLAMDAYTNKLVDDALAADEAIEYDPDIEYERRNDK